MMQENKKYLIDGWAAYFLIDVIKDLKRQAELNEKKYSKKELLELIDTYDSVIKYLLNLNVKSNSSQKDYDIDGKLNSNWMKVLKKYKIVLSKK